MAIVHTGARLLVGISSQECEAFTGRRHENILQNLYVAATLMRLFVMQAGVGSGQVRQSTQLLRPPA